MRSIDLTYQLVLALTVADFICGDCAATWDARSSRVCPACGGSPSDLLTGRVRGFDGRPATPAPLPTTLAQKAADAASEQPPF